MDALEKERQRTKKKTGPKSKKTRWAHRKRDRSSTKSSRSSDTNNEREITDVESCSSVDKSMNDTLISDSNNTFNSDSSFFSPPKLPPRKKLRLKEARVVLVDVLRSKLLSPKQIKKPQDTGHDSEDSSLEIIPIDSTIKIEPREIKRESRISISSATTDSSVQFVCEEKPPIGRPKKSQSSSKSTQKRKSESCRNGKLSKNKGEKVTSNKKSRDSQKDKDNEGSVATVISISSSSSHKPLEILEQSKKSKPSKRKRNDAGNHAVKKSVKSQKTNNNSSANRRKRNADEINVDFPKTPKIESTSDLTSDNHSEGPPLLSPQNVIKSQPKFLSPPVLNISSGTEVALGLDEKDCCLDSIAAAIENDLASGNRLSPVGDCLDISGILPIDSCLKEKPAVVAEPDAAKFAEEGKEESIEVLKRGSESHKILSSVSASSCVPDMESKQRNRPAIVEENILPEGTVVVESKLTLEKITERLIDSEVDSSEKVSSAIYISTKYPEIAALLQNSDANIGPSGKSDGVGGYDDALNNNQEINFVNKNSLDSEKQEEKVTLYASGSPAESLDFTGEYNTLSGLLTSLDGGEEAVTYDNKSIDGLEDCLELDHNDDEIDEAIELFTASVMSNSCAKENTETCERTEKFDTSIVVNSGNFENLPSGSKTAGKLPSLSSRRASEADSLREGAPEDLTERDAGFAENQRKRKWISNDNLKSPPPAKQKIRLIRRNWDNNPKETANVASAANKDSAQTNNCHKTNVDRAPKISSPAKRPKEPEKKVNPIEPINEESSDSDSSSSDSSSSGSSSSSSDSDNNDDEETPKEEKTPRIPEKKVEPFGTEKEQPDDDQDDCISLYPESLCTSRCGSPPVFEMPMRRSPLYKRMKPDNIDIFVKANEKECDAVIEAHKMNLNNDKNERSNKVAKRKILTGHSPIKGPQSATKLPQFGTINSIENGVTARPQPPKQQQPPQAKITPLPDDGTAMQKILFLFRGQCFSWLKTGQCINATCKFQHALKHQLQVYLLSPSNVEAIVEYAIGRSYRYFIEFIHEGVVKNMNKDQILSFYCRLYKSQLLTDSIILNTINALTHLGSSLQEAVAVLNHPIIEGEVETPYGILRAILTYREVEPGFSWEVLGILISKVIPPVWLVERVLDECMRYGKSREHIIAVYEQLIKRLPSNILICVNTDLLNGFHGIRTTDSLLAGNSANLLAGNSANLLPGNNANNQVETQCGSKEGIESPCDIASPDSPQASRAMPFPENLSELEQSTTTPTSISDEIAINEFEYVVECTEPSSADSSRRRTSTSDQTGNYSVVPIDNVPLPQSSYSSVMWKFHLDLQGVRAGLEHKDYGHVKGILEENIRNPDRLPHMKGFYNILCKEITSAKQHLAALLRLTVQSGASNVLHQFMYDLAVHVLVKLADTGAWVHARELLKTLRVYGNYNNTCAFTLLAAEINIANFRPLKALALLRQSRLLFTNTKVWKQLWSLDDKPLRVLVIDTLLRSLCEGHAQEALSLLEFIIFDQSSCYRPINVSRHVDKVARALLRKNLTESILDFGKLILTAHFPVEPATFKALIRYIFHNDRCLARQLYEYSTWLGVYNRAKISHMTQQIVQSDLTEEELYLMISALINDLATNIGHAIDRLGPRKLVVVLLLETVPSERDLCQNPTSNPSATAAAIKKRKLMLQNLLNKFNPRIKLVQKCFGKICKVQSTSLVNHLKTGRFDQ